MIVQVVKFASGLSDEKVRRTIDERAPSYRAMPGLLQKLFASSGIDTRCTGRSQGFALGRSCWLEVVNCCEECRSFGAEFGEGCSESLLAFVGQSERVYACVASGEGALEKAEVFGTADELGGGALPDRECFAQ